MTREVVIQDELLLKGKIIELVHMNHSSISLIAEYLDSNPEHVKHLILEALKEGKITGRFSEDELRFYRSDVKKPDPSSMVEKEEPTRPSLLVPKAILLGGVALFVAGQIIIRMASEGTGMYNFSTALVFGGLFTIAAGLYAFTRFG